VADRTTEPSYSGKSLRKGDVRGFFCLASVKEKSASSWPCSEKPGNSKSHHLSEKESRILDDHLSEKESRILDDEGPKGKDGR
jgi:hypothetical protein